MAGALSGLTLDEARYALRRALATGLRLGPESMPALLEEKRLLVNRSGFIEYIADVTKLGEIGGLEYLKKWLLERRKLFQMRESLSNDIVPKGILMMGIPGCGKSLSVKAIASCFELPLYRIDMIEIFSGRHGKPEGVFVQACRMMEDLAPAVLWFDEIEMGVTATESSGEQGRIDVYKRQDLNNLLYGHLMPHKEWTNSPQVRKIILGVSEYLAAQIQIEFDLPESTEVADACGVIEHKR